MRHTKRRNVDIRAHQITNVIYKSAPVASNAEDTHIYFAGAEALLLRKTISAIIVILSLNVVYLYLWATNTRITY